MVMFPDEKEKLSSKLIYCPINEMPKDIEF